MPPRNPPLPNLWLISDPRNDAMLNRALAALPRGSGFVFRHYHLPPARRRDRFEELLRIARTRGHLVALSGDPREALRWGCDAIYGPARRLGGAGDLVRIATAHSLRELGDARRARADGVFLSPVFATRSHPGAVRLGPVRALLLARQTPLPVIALGGMDADRGRRLSPLHGWAAIDGLSTDWSRSARAD